jgi:drug/metabolite transporter (DMT)-like permease
MDSQTENVAVLEQPISTSAPLASFGVMRALISRWWVAFALSSVCVVSGHLMIKSGLNSVPKLIQATLGERILHAVLQPEVFIGLLVYMFGTACWMIAVSQKEISFLYPLSSVNYVLVVVASALLFAETIPGLRAAGVALIVAGMFLLNRKSRRAA